MTKEDIMYASGSDKGGQEADIGSFDFDDDDDDDRPF